MISWSDELGDKLSKVVTWTGKRMAPLQIDSMQKIEAKRGNVVCCIGMIDGAQKSFDWTKWEETQTTTQADKLKALLHLILRQF